jgi:uncharacterized protein
MAELFYPFSLSPTGSIASTGANPSLEAQQHVDALVSTQEGERVMLPTYGVNVAQNLFLNNPDAIAAAISNDVQKQMAIWEPSVKVISVNPVYSDLQEGFVNISVDYAIAASPLTPNNVNTATVLVGGQVIQILRGQGS